jgi:hypothetical protein
MTRRTSPYFMNTWPLELRFLWRKSPYPGARYVKIDIAMVSAITCKNMFRHPKFFIARSVSPWGMMIGYVGLMTSCMKGQETYTKFKEKYNKKETLRSTTLLGEETSILAVDSEDEDEEAVWVEARD